MSDTPTGANEAPITPTPKLPFGQAATPILPSATPPQEQKTPLDAGPVETEILPDEAADYADVAPSKPLSLRDHIQAGLAEEEEAVDLNDAPRIDPENPEPAEDMVMGGYATQEQVDTAAEAIVGAGPLEANPTVGSDVVFPDAPAAAIGGDTPAEVANQEAGIVPATNTGLDQMSADELKRLEEAAHAALLKKQQDEKAAVIAQIVQVVKTYGIGTEELVEALGGLKLKRKGVKAVAKYRDPVTGITWSGRGKEPTWLRGKDRAQFAITE